MGPDRLLWLRGAKALCRVGKDMMAQSSSSGHWGFWERKYSLEQQNIFLWIWELDQCSRARLGLKEDIHIPILPTFTVNSIRPLACKNATLLSLANATVKETFVVSCFT